MIGPLCYCARRKLSLVLSSCVFHHEASIIQLIYVIKMDRMAGAEFGRFLVRFGADGIQ
jgi:hypothetical protein